MPRWLPWALALACMACAIIPIARTACLSVDGDEWFILATGREVVEHGIPRTNSWSVHPGMRIVVQQWLFGVVSWLAWSSMGHAGLAVLTLLATAVLAWLLWRLTRVVAPSLMSPFRLSMVALALVGLTCYIGHRPHVWTMCVCVACVTCLERYRRGGSWKALVPLPALACLEANCQAAMVALPIGCAVLCALPTLPIRGVTWTHDGYRRRAVWAAACAMCLAALANPYGIDGVLYALRSVDVPAYRDRIVEMCPIWASHGNGTTAIIRFLMWSAAAVLCVASRTRRVDQPLTVACVVCVIGGVLVLRNVWIVVPFALALLAGTVEDAGMAVPDEMLVIPCLLSGLSLALALVTSVTYMYLPGLDGAAKVLSGADGVCSTFDYSGWLELEGHRVSIDARPELWEPAISGTDDHWYLDYTDQALSGDMTDYVERSGCSWALTVDSRVLDNESLEGTLRRLGWDKVYDEGYVRVWHKP